MRQSRVNCWGMEADDIYWSGSLTSLSDAGLTNGPISARVVYTSEGIVVLEEALSTDQKLDAYIRADDF